MKMINGMHATVDLEIRDKIAYFTHPYFGEKRVIKAIPLDSKGKAYSFDIGTSEKPEMYHMIRRGEKNPEKPYNDVFVQFYKGQCPASGIIHPCAEEGSNGFQELVDSVQESFAGIAGLAQSIQDNGYNLGDLIKLKQAGFEFEGLFEDKTDEAKERANVA